MRPSILYLYLDFYKKISLNTISISEWSKTRKDFKRIEKLDYCLRVDNIELIN